MILMYKPGTGSETGPLGTPELFDTLNTFGVLDMNSLGDVLVVGKSTETGTFTGEGLVEIYTRTGSGFVLSQILSPSDVNATDWLFGKAVKITPSGDRILVGSPGANGDDGAIYKFDRSGATWTETEIIPGPLGLGEGFGYDLETTVDGTKMTVQSPNKVSTTTRSSLYEESGGTFTFSQFLVWDGMGEATGGASDVLPIISGDGNVIAVSSITSNGSEGSATVYKWNGSAYVASDVLTKFVNNDPGDYFRIAAINYDGSRLVASVPGYWSNTTPRVGIAIRFTETTPGTWITDGSFLGSSTANDYNNRNIVMSDDGTRFAMSGADNDLASSTNLGQIRLWLEKGPLGFEAGIFPPQTPTPWQSNVRFGDNLAMSGNARYIAGTAAIPGVVYIYKR